MDQTRHNYDAVDLAKFICCLFIVGVHTAAFSDLCRGGITTYKTVFIE